MRAISIAFIVFAMVGGVIAQSPLLQPPSPPQQPSNSQPSPQQSGSPGQLSGPDGRFFGPITNGTRSSPLAQPQVVPQSQKGASANTQVIELKGVTPSTSPSPCSVPLLSAKLPGTVHYTIQQAQIPPTLDPMPQAKVPAPSCDSVTPAK